ncbi:hypothetical protein L509_0938 [Bordetella bronchiseptica M85/00/2]|nr:hypothetical protein L509_0938 [Bordetella bronchiseptica M85/00/2]
MLHVLLYEGLHKQVPVFQTIDYTRLDLKRWFQDLTTRVRPSLFLKILICHRSPS